MVSSVSPLGPIDRVVAEVRGGSLLGLGERLALADSVALELVAGAPPETAAHPLAYCPAKPGAHRMVVYVGVRSHGGACRIDVRALGWA